MMKEFTAKELESFTGKGGSPAYTSYDGKIYDVSGSQMWEEGLHFGTHWAGKDLTEEMSSAPHGPEVFDQVTQVWYK